MLKKLFIRKIHNLFYQVENHSWYKTLWNFPLFIRMTIGGLFFLYGLLAFLTPLPAGILFLILGGFLIFGKDTTRVYTLRMIYFFRLHILFGKILLWWKSKK